MTYYANFSPIALRLQVLQSRANACGLLDHFLIHKFRANNIYIAHRCTRTFTYTYIEHPLSLSLKIAAFIATCASESLTVRQRYRCRYHREYLVTSGVSIWCFLKIVSRVRNKPQIMFMIGSVMSFRSGSQRGSFVLLRFLETRGMRVSFYDPAALPIFYIKILPVIPVSIGN